MADTIIGSPLCESLGLSITPVILIFSTHLHNHYLHPLPPPSASLTTLPNGRIAMTASYFLLPFWAAALVDVIRDRMTS